MLSTSLQRLEWRSERYPPKGGKAEGKAKDGRWCVNHLQLILKIQFPAAIHLSREGRQDV